jgi:arsenite-transporting ATPase
MDLTGAEARITDSLVARQIDATQAFSTFRDEYRGRIDDLFEGLAGRGVDIAHDREIIRDLLALAPPGVDELYALTVLGEELEEGRFDCIIVDPAPTGHLLRLLDMPKLAVAWAHQLMRLMLKYKDIVGLGDAAAELLHFAKRTRALDARFRDRDRAATAIVTLDEPLVRGESVRLARELESRHLALNAIIWNRASAITTPLPTDASIPQLFAPVAAPPPVGVDAIRAWSNSWGMLSSSSNG